MLTDIAALLAFGEKYGWGLVIALFLLYKVIANASKIANGLGKAAGAVSPQIGKALDERRKEKEAQRVEKAVETSAELAAKIEQSEATLHHELDSDAVEQAHALRQDDRMLGIVERTLDNFWQEQQRQSERWTTMLQAIADNKTALMSMKSTLSLHSQVIAQQVDAFAALECVKAARRAVYNRKVNGD